MDSGEFHKETGRWYNLSDGLQEGSGDRLGNLKIRTLFVLNPKDRKPQKPINPRSPHPQPGEGLGNMQGLGVWQR